MNSVKKGECDLSSNFFACKLYELIVSLQFSEGLISNVASFMKCIVF